jgi:hypothetical protein
MDPIEPRDPPPVPCVDHAQDAPSTRASTSYFPAQAPPASTAHIDVPPDVASGPCPSESGPARHVYSPTGDLPHLAARIDEAQRQARERRVQQGLPAEADDGAYLLKRPRKHAPKRSKKHGQFLGTVCDSWDDKTRPR